MSLLRWLRSLVLHRRLERDMHEEMSQHVERATERLMARGLSREEARRAALREFGNVHYLQSVTAFTVARRTREIGVRVALGAKPARLAATTFRRPLTHVAFGLTIGIWLCALLGWGADVGMLWWKPLLGLLGYILVMTAVCLSACVVPMRRALDVDPTVALSADA